jgi:Short C-terminal domain
MTNENPGIPDEKRSVPIPKTNITDEILKLAELKDKGVLTDEEFSTAKAALLHSLHAAVPPDQVAANAPKPDVTVCPECKREIRIPESSMGDDIKCPGCRTKFIAVPGLGSRTMCPKCLGSGRCKKCKGKGEVRTGWLSKEKEECPKCEGEGECPKCGGTGWQ